MSTALAPAAASSEAPPSEQLGSETKPAVIAEEQMQSSVAADEVPPQTPTPATTSSAVPQISEQELRNKLRQVFDEFDVDSSGTVSVDEMFQAADSLDLGIPPEKLAALIKETDVDGSGEVDFDEFLLALRKHMTGEEGDAQGLGSVFAAKSDNMFADLWSNFSGAFTSPFKALDNIISTPLSLFSGGGDDVADEKKRPQNELEERHEVTRRDLTEQLEREVKKVYGKWDFQHSPPRKAATPKRSDCMAYTPKSALVTGVPKAKFASEEAAKAFFSTPRVASTGAHSAAHMARMQVRTNWSNPQPLPLSWGVTNVRPPSFRVPPRMLSPPSMRSGGTPPASRR